MVGLGNWFYPRSRENLGIYLLNRIGDLSRMKWSFNRSFCADYAAINRVIFVRPKAYQHKFMNRTVFPAAEVLEIAPRDIILLVAHPSLPIGAVQSHDQSVPWSDAEKEVPAVECLMKHFDTLRARPTRHYFGVSPLDGGRSIVRTPLQAFTRNERMREEQIQLYFKNVFRRDEMVVVDDIVEDYANKFVNLAGGSVGKSRVRSL